jgi:hypothetical protein
MRGNDLSHRVWGGYKAIIAACCDGWNKLMQMPERIASLTEPDGKRLGIRRWNRGIDMTVSRWQAINRVPHTLLNPGAAAKLLTEPRKHVKNISLTRIFALAYLQVG